MKKQTPIILFLLFFFLSCDNSKKEKTEAQSKFTVNKPLIRLDSVLFTLKTIPEITLFLEKNKAIVEPYFDVTSKNFPELAKNLAQYIQNPALIGFYNNTVNSPQKIKLDSLQIAINQAFSNIKATYPNYKIPKIYTFFTGFAGKDLLVTDSTIMIGLEYFGGKTATYRPQVYDYQLNRYEQAYILPSILNQVAINFAKINPADKSLLADMLFYGKCYQFTKNMLPEAPDSLITGYSQKQLDATEISQEMVWAHFIDQKLLYENSPFKKTKYLDERPNTQEISPDCPGMIGRWLGYKIITKYLENNKTQTLKNVLANGKAQEIFEQSKYKGRADL